MQKKTILSIRLKLMIIFATITLMSMLLVGIIMFNNANNSIQMMIEDESMSNIQSIIKYIDMNASDALRIAQKYSTNELMLKSFEKKIELN